MRVFSRWAARKSESFGLVGKAEGVGFEPTEAFTSLVFKTEADPLKEAGFEVVTEVFCRISAEVFVLEALALGIQLREGLGAFLSVMPSLARAGCAERAARRPWSVWPTL